MTRQRPRPKKTGLAVMHQHRASALGASLDRRITDSESGGSQLRETRMKAYHSAAYRKIYQKWFGKLPQRQKALFTGSQ